MKKILSMVFALVLASTAFAQNVLEITDISTTQRRLLKRGQQGCCSGEMQQVNSPDI